MPGGCQASLAQRGDRRRFFGRGSHSLRFQQRGDIDRRQRREADQLTAGPDGRQYGIQIGGDQEQDRPIGRFFERFQQRIGRDVIHRIGVVNDRDLPRAGQRTQRQVVTQPLLIVVADDLADGELPLAGFAFDEEIIRMRAGQKWPATGALAAGFELVARTTLAQQAFGEPAGEQLLADPLRSNQQVGLRQPAAFDGPSKHLDLVDMPAKAIPDRRHATEPSRTDHIRRSRTRSAAARFPIIVRFRGIGSNPREDVSWLQRGAGLTADLDQGAIRRAVDRDRQPGHDQFQHGIAGENPVSGFCMPLPENDRFRAGLQIGGDHRNTVAHAPSSPAAISPA